MAARANYVFWLAEISKNSSETTWPIELKFGENDEGIDLYKVLWVFLSIGNSRWPPPQDIVYKGPYGKTSELTNPPTVVLTQW